MRTRLSPDNKPKTIYDTSYEEPISTTRLYELAKTHGNQPTSPVYSLATENLKQLVESLHEIMQMM